ncbi:hypothetical protein [Sphingomonas sp.]|uniref:hypothetical protein n=1 Tax=Sphingomonas sp. TaxID=28214 RepID=UPI0031D2354B
MILIGPTATLAQNREDRIRAVDALIACRTLGEDATRLACFDRAAAALSQARASGELMVLDRQTVVARKQQRFGLTTQTGEMFGGAPADEATEVRQLIGKIAAIVPAKAYGRFDIQLDNGSVWQTTEALPFPPKAGADVTIRQGSLGAYRASIAGGRSILVKRIR